LVIVMPVIPSASAKLVPLESATGTITALTGIRAQFPWADADSHRDPRQGLDEPVVAKASTRHILRDPGNRAISRGTGG
jgi:hypothetical protein